MTKRVLLALTVTLFCIIGILPVFSMLLKSIIVDGNFSIVAYKGVMSSQHQWILLWHSMLMPGLVAFFTVAIGVPLGIILGKSDLPFRRFFVILFIIPLLIPPYIMAVSWSDFLGQGGLLSSFASDIVINITSGFLFGLPGCVFILFSVFLPIPIILTMISLKTINPSLEEAGRLTSGWNVVLRRIIIPLIMPGIMLSALLVFVLSFGEGSVPSFLRYDVFPVESFIQFSAFYNFEAATAAAVPLAGITLIILLLEDVFLRRKTYMFRPAAALNNYHLIVLGKYKAWLFSAVTIMAFIVVIVPMIVLVVQSSGINAYIVAINKAGDSIVRSIVYAIIGASLLSISGFFIGYLIQKKVFRFWRTIDSFTIFLLALPGTVIGIGLVSLWNTSWTNIIYASPIIIILGYLAKYTALTSRITISQLSQISVSMEEAAQVAGAYWLRRVIFIIVPLARNGLLAGWLVGYIFCLRDTDITMLVYPAGHATLPVRILTLMANGSPEMIAALCIIMIVVVLLPAGVLWGLFRCINIKS